MILSYESGKATKPGQNVSPNLDVVVHNYHQVDFSTPKISKTELSRMPSAMLERIASSMRSSKIWTFRARRAGIRRGKSPQAGLLAGSTSHSDSFSSNFSKPLQMVHEGEVVAFQTTAIQGKGPERAIAHGRRPGPSARRGREVHAGQDQMVQGRNELHHCEVEACGGGVLQRQGLKGRGATVKGLKGGYDVFSPRLLSCTCRARTLSPRNPLTSRSDRVIPPASRQTESSRSAGRQIRPTKISKEVVPGLGWIASEETQ